MFLINIYSFSYLHSVVAIISAKAIKSQILIKTGDCHILHGTTVRSARISFVEVCDVIKSANRSEIAINRIPALIR